VAQTYFYGVNLSTMHERVRETCVYSAEARVDPLPRLPLLASGLPTMGRTRATTYGCAVFSLVLRGGNCLVATAGAAGVGAYGARSPLAKPAL